MTATTTMRLRRLTVTCGHREDRAMATAHETAIDIAKFHGWPSASLLQDTCGCFSLFRSQAEIEAHMAANEITGIVVKRGSRDPMPGRGRMH